jgi:hypothetical protein
MQTHHDRLDVAQGRDVDLNAGLHVPLGLGTLKQQRIHLSLF